MYHDRGSRHVGFASEPVYSRPSRQDEVFVMEHFDRHARKCPQCRDPYLTYLSGGTLCDDGHKLAQDVAHYVYSKGGKAYSTVDRESLGQRVRVEIPPECDRVRGLLRAVDHGLRVRKSRPVVSHDKSYYVPLRPEKRSHYVDRYGVPKASRRNDDGDHRYYDDRHRYYEDRRHGSNSRHNWYLYPEKRQSMPAKQASYGGLWEKGGWERKHGRPIKYDYDPRYYYKPSRYGPEMRIPRSESPKREPYRRTVPEDYRSAKYERSPRHDNQDIYRSSGYHSPNSRVSSRHTSPDSYRSYRRTSPEGYSSKRSTWSPDRLYREFLR